MKKLTAKYWKLALSLLVGMVAFAFWRWMYPFALAYQEQFQLFLLDDCYFLSRIACPGGLARYAGEFLVQFYNTITIGALLLAMLYVLIQRMVWRLACSQNRNLHACWYVLSFLPVVSLWLLMGDENVLMTFVVAFVLQLAVLLCCPQGKAARLAYWIVMIPVCYWFLGPVVVMLVVYLILTGVSHEESKWNTVGIAAIQAIFAIACLLLSAKMVHYPLEQLFYGIDYYRYFGVYFYPLFFLELLSVALPFIMAHLPQHPGKHLLYGVIAFCIVIGSLSAVFFHKQYDSRKYDLIEYDYLERQHRWNDIIAKSERHMPDLPMSVSITNLALGMTQQLGDRVFHFYQNGVEGLLPHFERNHQTALSASEIYYQLGMTNTAQRFAFEAQEAIPNYNKSARLTKRLAETNLINGQYKVAVKYLRLLQKTLFYRKWADRMMALAGNRKAVDQHPLYGYMRRCHLRKDFLYSETEADKILGLLFMQNKENMMAMQYMAVYPLLERDLQKFMQYLPLIENHQLYNPRAIQEGVAIACMQQHQQPPQGFLDPMTEQRFRDFAQTYANGGKSKEQLSAFKDTFWFYMMAKTK